MIFIISKVSIDRNLFPDLALRTSLISPIPFAKSSAPDAIPPNPLIKDPLGRIR